MTVSEAIARGFKQARVPAHRVELIEKEFRLTNPIGGNELTEVQAAALISVAVALLWTAESSPAMSKALCDWGKEIRRKRLASN